MIRDICKDVIFLAQRAEPATPDDLPVAADLLDTLAHHREGCVGMAANMIGVNKRIIVFDQEGSYMVMFNPEIVKHSGPYDAEEGCLSLTGENICIDGGMTRQMIYHNDFGWTLGGAPRG